MENLKANAIEIMENLIDMITGDVEMINKGVKISTSDFAKNVLSELEDALVDMKML